jgi:hypothetical protein
MIIPGPKNLIGMNKNNGKQKFYDKINGTARTRVIRHLLSLT